MVNSYKKLELNFELKEDILLCDSQPFTGKLERNYGGGEKKSIKQYRLGKAHGVAKEWFDNGKLKKVCLFKDGKVHGNCRKYWPSGILAEDNHFREGLENGTFESFDARGNLVSRSVYSNGKLLQVNRFDNNQDRLTISA